MLFQTTRGILFEVGASARVGELLKNHSKHVLLVTDKFLHDLGLVKECVRSLKEQNITVTVFDDVSPDPTEASVLQARDAAAELGVDGVVGFGGGSSMDVAKVVAYLAHEHNANTHIGDVYGVGNCSGPRLPLVQIPTTAGTGSEVTPISILTTGEKSKMGVVSPVLLPDWAVLDGELTRSVPPATTAYTGIDAMIHAIEAFTTKTKKNPLSDLFAREGLRLLASNIRTAVFQGDDAQARGEMLLGSMYAGMAFANAPVAAVHALAYPIGSHFKVPHGHSCSLMLPGVLQFNAPVAAALYADLGHVMFPEVVDAATAANDPHRAADQFVTCVEDLITELNVPSRLADVGIAPGDVDMLVAEAMKQTRLLPNNPREVTAEDARAIYQATL